MKGIPYIRQNFQNVQLGDLPEVFYYQHGLHFAPFSIKRYVFERDIMDIGAYFGDSAYVLLSKTKRRVFSYEISEDNLKAFRFNAKRLEFPKRSILIPNAVSDSISKITIDNCFGLGCSIKNKGNIDINTTTIDYEVNKYNMTLGFIKADVEGEGLKVLRGGMNSILKYRPVMDISIYHSYDELFEVSDIIANLPNYGFEYHSGNAQELQSFGELSIFAYPNEIVK